jgi:hypothetical protein
MSSPSNPQPATLGFSIQIILRGMRYFTNPAKGRASKRAC